MRKILVALFALISIVSKAQPVNHLVISRVNPQGNNPATCGKFGSYYDGIEIFNPTSSPISLNGYSVQYADASSDNGVTQVTALPDFVLQPGQNFLIVEFGSCPIGPTTPSADQVGTINLASAGGKVFLVNSTSPLNIADSGCPGVTTSIVDFVGYGSTNCFEGPVSAGTFGEAIRRNNGGCVDNNVSGDFSPDPLSNGHNSATPFNICFSANAGLSNLVISQGTLSPAFATNTISYTASVAYSVTSLTVTPTLADATATITVNALPVTNGSLSGPVSFSVGSNIITTVVTAQDGTTTKTYSVNVTRAAPSVTFSGKVFLQGPYNAGTGTMNNSLNTSGILQSNASTQPYNITGFDYAGTENVAGGFFVAHPEIVDWVMVELRDASVSTTVVARRAAFLKQDGNLLETDGLNDHILFAGVTPGSYFVVIRHRNHLGIMSSVTVDFNSGTGSYDFTTPITKAFAGAVSNPPVATLATGVFGMYAGNSNVDSTIRKTGSASVNDYSLLLNAVSSAGAPGPTGVYRNEDVIMDGNIRKTGSASSNDYSKLLSILGSLNIITQPLF